MWFRDRWTGLSARRRGLVVFLAVVVTAGVAAVVVQVAGHGDAPGGVPSQERVGPVLLVPGYGGSRDALSTLAGRIRRSGRAAEVLALPGNGTGDLRAQVRVLDRVAADAVAAGAPSVDVIGYSAGGVVARLWVAGEGAGVVRRVVTLGAPLHGTRIAAVGGVVAPGACPVACQQLSPGSALLSSVDGAPVALPWLSVWTEDDRTVVPPDSARLDGAVNVSLQRVCPGTSVAHSGLPADPLVTGLVLRALGTAPLVAPDTGDCDRLREEGASS
nr:putative lipase class 2 [uncultured bacterium]